MKAALIRLQAILIGWGDLTILWMQDAAIQHYKGFIEVSRCLVTLRDRVELVSQNLDVLQEDLPRMDEACTHFVQGAQSYADKQTKTKQLLRRSFCSATWPHIEPHIDCQGLLRPWCSTVCFTVWLNTVTLLITAHLLEVCCLISFLTLKTLTLKTSLLPSITSCKVISSTCASVAGKSTATSPRVLLALTFSCSWLLVWWTTSCRTASPSLRDFGCAHPHGHMFQKRQLWWRLGPASICFQACSVASWPAGELHLVCVVCMNQ